jgi:lysophospholipase L1-like esterase
VLRPCAAALLALSVALTASCSSSGPDVSGPQGVVASITTSAARTAAGPSTSDGPTGWYLALGDSLAAGRQPTTGDEPTRGYAGPVLAALQRSQPGTALKNLGCSGETTGSLLRGGLCPYPEGTQLAAATAFLAAHPGAVRLVTLDIGANNVLGCAGAAIDPTCATTSTAGVATDLAAILGRVRAAAPQARIVVLTYYNPLLAAYRQGPAGRAYATTSQPLLASLNDVVRAAAGGVGAGVADVAGAFETANTSGTPEPANVARVCAWTWMCSRQDIHANDEGYAAMARAVLAAL